MRGVELNTAAAIFAPPILALLAGLALGVGAVLFVVYRRGADAVISLRVPLSWTEPIEVRLILYLVFGAVWGTGAVLFRLLYILPREGSVIAGLLLLASILLTLGNLTFFYAALGSLLQAALGTTGRPPFLFSRFLSWFDNLVMDAGDLVASVLLRPAGAQTRGRKQAMEVEVPFESEVVAPVSRESRTSAAELRARQARDLARARIDLALEHYEQALTPSQREKLRLMREIVESLMHSFDGESG